jgi:very-short-patch-repair endonuclease
MTDEKKEPMLDEQEREKRTLQEKHIHKVARQTRLERRTWESMIVFAMHYALRGVEISLQHAIPFPANELQRRRALADAYLPQYNILVEVDEEQHNEEEDRQRDHLIRETFRARRQDPPEIHRISIRRGNVYAQLDNVIQRIKERTDQDPPAWTVMPEAGTYQAEHYQRLLAANIFEKMDALSEMINKYEDYVALTHYELRDANPPRTSQINLANGEYGFHVEVEDLEVSVSARHTGDSKFVLFCNEFVRKELTSKINLSDRESNGNTATIVFGNKSLNIGIRNCPTPYFVFESIIDEHGDEEPIGEFSQGAPRSDDSILQFLEKLRDLQK